MRGWWTVFRKELLELLRDPKALLVSLGLPALLMPLLFILLSAGVEETNDWLAGGVPIIVENLDSETAAFLEKSERFELLSGTAEVGRLRSGEAALLVSAQGEERLIRYDGRSQRSLAAAQLMADLLKQISRRSTVTVRLEAPTGRGDSGTLLLSMALPLLLLVASAVTPLASAADLGAGEKERGTLEPLLTSRVSRRVLLLGKAVALWLVALAGALSFLAGTGLAYLLAPGVFDLSIEWAVFRPNTLAVLVAATLLMGLTFATVELFLSFLARSVREAQSFFLPLLILAVAAGYGTLGVDPLYTSQWSYLIPLANLALTVKASLLGSLDPSGAILAVSSSLLYVSLALRLGVWQLNREEVLARI